MEDVRFAMEDVRVGSTNDVEVGTVEMKEARTAQQSQIRIVGFVVFVWCASMAISMCGGAWIYSMNTQTGYHHHVTINDLDQLHEHDQALFENMTNSLTILANSLPSYPNESDRANRSRRLSGQLLYKCEEWDSGELRSYGKPRNCVDVAAYDGMGGVQTFLCDGHLDQQWVFCLEPDSSPYAFTIRSRESGFVLEETGWNVEAKPLVPGRKSQHWYFTHWWNTWSFNGVKQPALARIGNRGSRHCLDIAGIDSEGNIGSYHCEWRADQFFFIYNRGAVLGHGTLRNSKSKEFLDVAGYSGHGNIGTFVGDGRLDLSWTLYESGELVNGLSRYCLDVAGYEGRGNVATFPCDAEDDQRWLMREFGANTFILENMDSKQCLDVLGYQGRGNVATYACQYVHDQAWFWDDRRTWSPKAYWAPSPVGCHNDEQTYSVQQGISDTQTFTKEFALAVGVEMSAGVEVSGVTGSTTVSAEASASMSWEFQKSWSKTESITRTCHQAGCMWHVEMSLGDGRFTWYTPYTFCSSAKPTCQPFKSNAANYCY